MPIENEVFSKSDLLWSSANGADAALPSRWCLSAWTLGGRSVFAVGISTWVLPSLSPLCE